MNAHYCKTAYWVGQGAFDSLSLFSEFESRVNDIFEEKDRGDVFEIFIEGYLATRAITQHVEKVRAINAEIKRITLERKREGLIP